MRRDKATAREIQILELVGAGYEYKEIATRLHISIHTVQSTVTRSMYKLRAQNRTNAVINALKKQAMTLEQIPEYE
jgi:DNA-binding NarL/FixJ family response regulator